MNTYPGIVILHVGGAIALAVGALGLLSWMITLNGGRAPLRSATALDKAVPIGAGVVLGTGLYMTTRVGGWDETWLAVGLGGLLLVAPLSPVVISPLLRTPESGASAPLSMRRRGLLASAALVGAVVSETFLMIDKPDGLVVALEIFLAGPAIGVGLAALIARGGRASWG